MTTQDSEPLRHIVHDDANGHKWGHVLRILAQWPDDDTLTIGVDYIENTMLRDLPRRHVPWRWLAQLKDRPDDPRWGASSTPSSSHLGASAQNTSKRSATPIFARTCAASKSR